MTKKNNNLFSEDNDKILDALFSISRSDKNDLDQLALIRIQELLTHCDPDIREQACIAIAIKLKLKSAYSELIKMIHKLDEKEFVLIAAANGLLALADQLNQEEKFNLERAYAKIVKNITNDSNFRGTCYLNLLLINNKITKKEYASSSNDINLILVDTEFVNKFLL